MLWATKRLRAQAFVYYNKGMKEKRLLLLQVRTNPLIRDHDEVLFRRVLKNDISYDVRNVTEYEIKPEDAEAYDGYILGGSHYMTYHDFTGKRELYELVDHVVQKKKPFLGVCFGFQILAEVTGGTVVHDIAKKEFGSYSMMLTHSGKNDPLFSGFSDSFLAQQAHESYASMLGDSTELLASGDFIQNQAFRHKDAPVYGVQFHPELSREGMFERMGLYNTEGGTFQFPQEVLDRVQDTKESERVLHNFLAIV